MARMQILYLPTGRDGDSRFSLVVDQAAGLTEADVEALHQFSTVIGSAGCVILHGEVSLDQDADLDEDEEEFAEELRQQLAAAFPASAAAGPVGHQPKLPPPDTDEGKRARLFGTNNTDGGQP